MVELRRIEIALGERVHVPQEVPVEGRGDALRVVVGQVDRGRIGDQVGAEQQEIVRLHVLAPAREQRERRPVFLVSDRSAQEEQQPAPAGGLARELQQLGVIGKHLLHRDLRAGFREDLLRPLERVRADVDGDVSRPAPCRKRGVEQRDGLRGGAAAELDHVGELGTPRRLDDGACSRLEQGPLRPCGKVLGQARDLLEERAPRVVVEVLAGDLAWGAQERVAQLPQGPALRVEPDQRRRARRVGPGEQSAPHAPGRRSPLRHIPPAHRKPLGISRTPGSYQFRRLGRNSSGEVAQDPPRSTRWVPNHGTEYPSYG